jgi:serine-type D-Ala-D-Ala carboxypeptidase (penicillin-binding protein 5/6)
MLKDARAANSAWRFEGSAVRFFRLSFVLAAAGLLTAPAPLCAENFSTDAPIALMEDYDSGTVLFEKNADDPMAPGATAKLLSAEIVFRELKEGRLKLDDGFDVSEKAWREGGAHSHGPATFLAIHSHVRIEDLLRGLIIQSGNDAAMTIAEGLAGTEENFAEAMNKRAAELGMAHSHFTDPRGKYDPAQRVTARDMALLAAHVIRDYPEYYHYFGEKEFTWNKIRQLNRNPLITMDIGADGLKAGDIAESGFALVGSAVQDNQRLIVILNGLKSAADRVEESRKLFNYAFHSFDRRVLYQAGDKVGSADVYGGDNGEIPLVSAQPVTLFLPRGESDKLAAKIVYTGPLVAPVERGREVGRLKVWRGDMLIIDVPLKTGADVGLGGLTRRAFDAGVELAGNVVRQTLGRALARQ